MADLPLEAARPGGFFVVDRRVLLVDSITEAIGAGAGCVVVSGAPGEAASTWNDGVISAASGAAVANGARPGLALRDWLQSAASAAAR